MTISFIYRSKLIDNKNECLVQSVKHDTRKVVRYNYNENKQIASDHKFFQLGSSSNKNVPMSCSKILLRNSIDKNEKE
jgi:hypothetical protein